MEKIYTINEMYNTSTTLKVIKIPLLLNSFTILSINVMEDIRSYLATRTPYRFNSNKDIADVTTEENECAKKIWMIIRHGSRYPNRTEIRYMNSRLFEIQDLIFSSYVNGNDALSDTTVLRISNWKPAVTHTTEARTLTKEGGIELFQIGKRMQHRYPQLLPPVFSNDTYLLKPTNTQRTKQSAVHFADALFGNLNNVYFPKPSNNGSDIPKYYKLCKRWNSEVDDNADILCEIALFEIEGTVQKTIKAVNRALGLTNELSLADIKMIYNTCGYETAWFRFSSSPWCLAFDSTTIKVLAYLEDLRTYLYSGYAFEINYKQACPTFRDLLDFFEDDTTKRTATIYFSHKTTLLKLISHLGLFRDEVPLLHSNYQPHRGKQWNQSKIGNFASNLAFILLNCNGTKRVILRHNEYVVRLPACPNSDICDLDVVKGYYKDSINNCDFDEICEN